MQSKYDPQCHIERVDTPPRSDEIFDQREITIQSYQTTVPFDYVALDESLDSAWLTPQIRFGVFYRSPSVSKVECAVILGLQDKQSIRVYDYDARHPIWYNWMDAVVDIVNIRYFKDENGLLRFTTTGGGRRITEEKLEEFNRTFLGITKDSVTKRQFDLAKLRDLCFVRFVDRLYMVRFSDPSGEEYKSIDHAHFQSRKYIQPDTERLMEVRSDSKAKIESFDSDITIRSDALSDDIQVRFFIKGVSGSLRLRFPKMSLVCQPSTPEEQANIFYRVVDKTVSAILDADYYAQHSYSLEDLDTGQEMFPEMVDLAPYRKVLTAETAREEFFSKLDMGEPWQSWQPHLRALNELVISEVIATHTQNILKNITKTAPLKVARLIDLCRQEPKLHSVGILATKALAGEIHAVSSDLRAKVEEALLSWAIDHETDSWRVDLEAGEINVYNLRWKPADLSLEWLHAALWKLVGLLHARLLNSRQEDNYSLLLQELDWCMTAAKALPTNFAKINTAFRLVAEQKVPSSISAGAKVLKEPVADMQALDNAVLDQFWLPLWPCLEASPLDGKIVILNKGIGAAIGVCALPTGELLSRESLPNRFDLLPQESRTLKFSDTTPALEIYFVKYGVERRIMLPVNFKKKKDHRPDWQYLCDVLASQTAQAEINHTVVTQGLRQIEGTVAPLPVALETINKSLRNVKTLQSERDEALKVPESIALEIHNEIADILEPHEITIWRTVRNCNGVQKDAFPYLQAEGIVNSLTTLNRRVLEIDKKLRKKGLPSCKASGPTDRYIKSGGYADGNGKTTPVELSRVEADWDSDPVDRNRTIQQYLALNSEEDIRYYHQYYPGIEDEAKKHSRRSK